MTKDEVRRLLQRHPRRGYILFRIFYIGFLAATAVLIILNLLPKTEVTVYVSWGWVVSCYIAGTASLLGWYSARDRFVMSRLVAEDPMIVYWAHAPIDLVAF